MQTAHSRANTVVVCFRVVDKALASDALQRYCNPILRNCNAIFDFKITLFYGFDDVVFAGS